jgi:DnaJ-class molecular chaperone
MNTMKIFTKHKCQECDGEGVVSHPAWQQFFEEDAERKRQTGEYATQEQCEEWFRKHGYYKLPPEEPKCIECNGQGEIEKWMPLKEVLALAETEK